MADATLPFSLSLFGQTWQQLARTMPLFDGIPNMTVTHYIAAGSNGPNKKDYQGAAWAMGIWSNDNSETSLDGSLMPLAK